MVTDIVFSSEEINLNIDGTGTIVADVLPEDADNKTLEWSSNSPSIASVTVDEDTHSATVKGVSEGEAIITAAATDGSGVSAVCNVVVSGSSPYPENANYYVPSVENYQRRVATSPTKYARLTFVDENGDELEIVPIEATQEEYNLGQQKFQLRNITRQQTIELYTFKNKQDRYIIGSTTNKSYIELYQPTSSYSSSISRRILFDLYYENENLKALNSNVEITTWTSTGEKYVNNFYLYFTDTTVKRQILANTGTSHGKMNYYSGNNYKSSKCEISSDRYYDENGVVTKFADAGLVSNVDWLIKINIMKDGVKIREDYTVFCNTGTSATRVERSSYKLQNEDGSYSYYTGLCELMDESQFPSDKEIDYEITFDITNVI